MNREEIRDTFRQLNPEVTERVATDTQLNDLLELGDKDFCAKTRCITNYEPETIETTENDESWDLTTEISKFYDLDTFPGAGVLYNDKQLRFRSLVQLDKESPNWRNNSSGTPTRYFRRGARIYTDKPIDSNEYDLKVYAVLISDDFDDDAKLPFNGLTYLEPFHFGLILWLQWKAKAKIAKPEESATAMQEYLTYALWARKEIGGTKFGAIHLIKKV